MVKMKLPTEIWYKIIKSQKDVNIRQVSKLFNDIFIDIAAKTVVLSIYNEYRKNYYVFKSMQFKFKVYNLNVLTYFSNVKDLTLTHPYKTCGRNDININVFLKYVSIDIKELCIYKDTTDINWEFFVRFKELTHLYVSSSMFYKVHYENPDDSDNSDTEPKYEYVDGSLRASVDKLIKILKNTKLYYFYVSTYDHRWSGIDNVFIIKDKVPDWEEELEKLNKGCQQREFTYDIV